MPLKTVMELFKTSWAERMFERAGRESLITSNVEKNKFQTEHRQGVDQLYERFPTVGTQ